MKNITPLLSGIILLILLGCSGGSPASPDSQPANDVTYRLEDVNFQSNSHLLGLWDVFVNPETETVEIIPSRGLAFTANVTRFIDGPPSNLLLKIITVDFQPDYVDLSADFGFRHPFPGFDQFTIFDTLGVFLGNGSDTYPGPGNFAIAGENDQQLLNPDGFTRWFNAPEFEAAGHEMPIFGYYPGANCPPDYFPTAVLNGYKYFADWLDEDGSAFEFLVNNSVNRGSIGSMSINYRRYDLRFPNDLILYFQYAFIAHWEPNYNYPDPPPNLDDFPPSANVDEAVVVDINSDESTLYFVDENNFGGNVCLDISPWDWSAKCNPDGLMEEYQIRCYSDAWTGGHDVNMYPVFQDEFFCTYETIIPVENLTSADPLKVMVEIIYPGLDYTNIYGIENDADGPLIGYFIIDVPVEEVLITGWARTWGGIEYDDAIGTVVDGSGNIYVTGRFMDTVDFDPSGGDPHTSNGHFDACLSKFDSAGNFLWARTWGGIDWDQSVCVKVDGLDNVYVSGTFQDIVDFDPGPGEDTHSSNGYYDAYLSKFDSAGNLLWALTWGGPGDPVGSDDTGRDICIDGSDNIYVLGNFTETVDFNPGGGSEEHTSNGGWDIFLSKFDSTGSFLWVRTWGGEEQGGGDIPGGVITDGSENIYVTGWFNEITDFDPGPGEDNHNPNGNYDAFLSKFDPSGNFQWARTWGWSGGSGESSGLTRGFDVATDGSGYVYVVGEFHGTVDFDPGPGTDNHSSNGQRDTYLSSFDSSGSFQWAQTWGGLIVFSPEIVTDGSWNIFVSGGFKGTVDFDPGTGTDNHTPPNGSSDAYFSKFDSSGAYQWVRTWGGSGNDSGYEVTVDSTGNVYIAGSFEATVDFAPTDPPCYDNPDEHTSNGKYDAFLVKYGPDGCW